MQLTRYITPDVKKKSEHRTPIENKVAADGPSSLGELDDWMNNLWR